MSNKLALPLADYMTVQGIYAGWDHTAYALLAQLDRFALYERSFRAAFSQKSESVQRRAAANPL
jgi:hypothetical protein